MTSQLLEPSIHHVPFPFDLLGILPMCQQVELLFSTLQQDLNTVTLPGADMTSSCANHLLFSLFIAHLTSVNDREVHLTNEQCAKFATMLQERDRDQAENALPFRFTDDCLADVIASTFRRQSTDSLLSHCSSETTEESVQRVTMKCSQSQPLLHHALTSQSHVFLSHFSADAGGMSADGGDSRSLQGSSTTTLNALLQGQLNRGGSNTPTSQTRDQSANIEDVTLKPIDDAPKWKCFIKAVTTTHIMMTFVPADYQNLLLLSEGRGGIQKLVTSQREYQATLKQREIFENAQKEQKLGGGDGRSNTDVDVPDLVSDPLSPIMGARGTPPLPQSGRSVTSLREHSSESTLCLDATVSHGLLSDVSTVRSADSSIATPHEADVNDQNMTADADSDRLMGLEAQTCLQGRDLEPVTQHGTELGVEPTITRASDDTQPSIPASTHAVAADVTNRSSICRTSTDAADIDAVIEAALVSEPVSVEACASSSTVVSNGAEPSASTQSCATAEPPDSHSTVCPQPISNERAITLPVYVYNCPLSYVTEHLVNRWTYSKPADLYEDLTFQLDECAEESRLETSADDVSDAKRRRKKTLRYFVACYLMFG